MFWDKLSTLLTNPKLIQEQYNRWLHKQNNTDIVPEEERNQTQNQIDGLSAQEKRYLSAFGEGAIDLDQYKEQTNDIKLQKSILEQKLRDNDSKEPKVHITLPDLDQMCDKITTVLTELSFEKKRRIAKYLLEDVKTDAKTATIEGYIPLQIIENIENVGFKPINRNRRVA